MRRYGTSTALTIDHYWVKQKNIESQMITVYPGTYIYTWYIYIGNVYTWWYNIIQWSYTHVYYTIIIMIQ